MKKYFVFIFLLTFVLGFEFNGIFFNKKIGDPNPAYLLASNLRVMVPNDKNGDMNNGYEGSGSSVNIGSITDKDGISRSLYITCNHVTEGRNYVSLLLNDSDNENMPINIAAYKSHVIYSDSDKDLSLIEADYYSPSVSFYSGPVLDGSPEIVIGNPLGTETSITSGFLSHYWLNQLEGTAPIINGNSGGGVFALQKGKWKLVGIAQAILSTPVGKGPEQPETASAVIATIPVTTVGIIIPINVVKSFLSEPAFLKMLKSNHESLHLGD